MEGILFAKSFALFRKLYANIEVQLFEHGGRRLEELLLAGDIELAASLLPVNPVFESHPISDLANRDRSRSASLGNNWRKAH
jgi:DNA-binding transcriptional LysR family regulator